MIRKVFVLISVLVAASSQMAFGQYQYSFSYESNGGIKTIFETSESAKIGLDGGDVLWDSSIIADVDKSINLGIYKENGQEGWDSDASFLVREERPTLKGGETAVIREIYLWAGTSVQPTDLELRLLSPPQLSPGVSYRLKLMSVPESVNYKGPTEWGAEDASIVLPFYSTNDGTTGYRFNAFITVVPEPSCMAALVMALACTGGIALKRTKKGRSI